MHNGSRDVRRVLGFLRDTQAHTVLREAFLGAQRNKRLAHTRLRCSRRVICAQIPETALALRQTPAYFR